MANASPDTKLIVLNDHYNQSVGDVKKLNAVRDRNFIFLALLVIVLMFMFTSPDKSQSIIAEILSHQTGASTTLGVGVLTVVLWFTTAFTAIKYFQTVVNLEKAYAYLGLLETELSKPYSRGVFTREGTNYLANYPWFSEWVNFMYRWLFPLIIVLSLLFKLSQEWHMPGLHTTAIWLDLLAFLTILTSASLYVWSMHQLTRTRN